MDNFKEDEDYYIFEEANPNNSIFTNSKADKVRASIKKESSTTIKTNRTPIPGDYASLFKELKAKCDPSNFMEPYDPTKVSISNEIYLLVLNNQNSENALIELRSRAIRELGIRFSTKKLYDELMDYCNPKKFTGGNYDNEKLCLANKLYCQITEKADDIEVLETIRTEAAPLREYIFELRRQKEFEEKAKEAKEAKDDTIRGIILCILFFFLIFIIVIEKI